ncbi:YegP family protein [Arenibacter certesii]|uniref:DUF1508 domain-containing protein n=1 Tax=Arenibacter certesii TaxID=228955 RepID=A0A918IQ68_9FLAO|nr:DUF1508 domain-containing protein [Arenibacter certesii]GGW26104.1 hypothetical protein GCM10007383_08870 [Arenibacter certesii]
MIQIKKESDHTYTFAIQTKDGQALLHSVPFNDKEKMERTISNLKEWIKRESSFERKTNYHGKFFFLLNNSDGTLIGNSMFYSSEAGMENGIKNLKNIISNLPETIA